MQLRSAHIATIVVGVAIVASAGVVLYNQSSNNSVSADVAVGNARLVVASGTVSVGDTLAASILVDTGSTAGNNTTAGVDVVLSYDTTLLEPVDDNPAIPGIQIEPGKIFDLVQANSVDSTLGQITFSTGQQPTGQPVTARDTVVATVHFKAKAVGQSPLRLTHKTGALDDSNVIQPKTGLDLLSGVQDGIVTIQ
jgi:hypothetical protein